MVSYFSAGTLWATKKGNPTKITPDDACGKKVAVQKATVQVDDITARSDKCKTAGKPGIQIDQYQGQDQATAAVVSGKDEAMLADSPVIAYAVKQTNGQLEKLGSIYDSAPYGYVVQKKDTAFADALAGAVAALDQRRHVPEDPRHVERRGRCDPHTAGQPVGRPLEGPDVSSEQPR